MGISDSEKIWVVCTGEEAYGPLSAVEIKKALLDNELKGDDSVWKKSSSKWKLIKEIPLYSYESKKSPGSGKSVTELSVPKAEDFEVIINPKLTTSDLKADAKWNARRLAIVGGSLCLFGVAGAAVAGVWTSKNDSEKRDDLQRKKEYIANKNL